MARYSSIYIIYNPNSTGPGQRLAKEVRDQLQKHNPKLTITIVATKRSQHAEELAYEHAMGSKHPLIISSSGDGGYHEVINGLIRACKEGADPVAGLLPAGNANDHFRHMHEADLIEAIEAGQEQTIDLLKFQYVQDGELIERYAHSYIGVGLTPQAGQELNKYQLNRLNQIWIVARVLLLSFRSVRLLVDGKIQSYDSIILSNIGKMSKLLSLSAIAKTDDGKFEVTIFRRRNKLRLISILFAASTRGLKGATQATTFRFTTVEELPVQLDGEILTLPADCQATVTIEPACLRCII